MFKSKRSWKISPNCILNWQMIGISKQNAQLVTKSTTMLFSSIYSISRRWRAAVAKPITLLSANSAEGSETSNMSRTQSRPMTSLSNGRRLQPSSAEMLSSSSSVPARCGRQWGQKGQVRPCLTILIFQQTLIGLVSMKKETAPWVSMIYKLRSQDQLEKMERRRKSDLKLIKYSFFNSKIGIKLKCVHKFI